MPASACCAPRKIEASPIMPGAIAALRDQLLLSPAAIPTIPATTQAASSWWTPTAWAKSEIGVSPFSPVAPSCHLQLYPLISSLLKLRFFFLNSLLSINLFPLLVGNSLLRNTGALAIAVSCNCSPPAAALSVR
jgi:hypothetical protein